MGWASRTFTSGHCRTDRPYIPRLKPARGALPPIAAVFVETPGEELPGKGSKSLSGGAGGKAPCPAEQRDAGTFLDQIEINRNKALGRGKHCGRFTIVGSPVTPTETRFHRVNCKCWDCSYCGPRRAKRYKWAIRAIAEKLQLRRFLTLTLDPAKVDDDPVRYLNKTFAKLRVYLRREHGSAPQYIRILEFQKSGNPHFHILLDRYIPQGWLRTAWMSVGGGKMVDIRYVDIHRVSRYLSKYLTKELLLSAPLRSRRVTTSRGIKLFEKEEKKKIWTFVRVPITRLIRIYMNNVTAISVDEDGVLEFFCTNLNAN
jgi:hypothetical protein